jgi:predicted transcriptional regulator
MHDGMPTMTHRTTFALDEATAGRLKHLASLWQVSQAEVVRRAVARAEAESAQATPDPIRMLQDLHANGEGLNPQQAKAYLREVREDRKRWRTK